MVFNIITNQLPGRRVEVNLSKYTFTFALRAYQNRPEAYTLNLTLKKLVYTRFFYKKIVYKKLD